MAVAGEGRNPGPEEMLKLAAGVGIKRRSAEETVAEVRAAVRRWPEFAGQAALQRQAAEAVADRIDQG